MNMVFVYGTLMRGEANHASFLSGAWFVRCAVLLGYGLYNVSYFPGIVSENGERVKGEVYEVNQSTLTRLDFLEGEGSLYIRREVDLDTSEGSMKAFAYIWNSDVDGMEKLNYEAQPWKGVR